jgi:UDP-2-acetamido-2-deoxy-ribo-hexuluronate aminotransferase
VFDEEIALRRQVAVNYDMLLSTLGDSNIHAPPHIESYNNSVYAQYTIRVQARGFVQEKLKVAGIPTAVHYPIPLNKQPAVADAGAHLPVSELLAEEVISLPMGPYITLAQQEYVVQTLANAFVEVSNIADI